MTVSHSTKRTPLSRIFLVVFVATGLLATMNLAVTDTSDSTALRLIGALLGGAFSGLFWGVLVVVVVAIIRRIRRPRRSKPTWPPPSMSNW